MNDININNSEHAEVFVEEEMLQTETSVVEEAPVKKSGKWKNVAYYLFLGLAFVLPFWIIPFGGFSLAASKSFLIYIFVLAAAVLYLIDTLQEGKIIYPKSISLLSLGVMLFVALLSSFFSVSPHASFWGTGVQTGTFTSFFALSMGMFLVSVLFRSEKKVLTFFFLFIVSSFIVFLCQVFRSVFNVGFGGLLPNRTSTLVGAWNELSIFFSFIALLTIIVLEFFGEKLAFLSTGRMWRIFLFFILGMSLFVMAFVNFTAAWIVFGLFLLVFLVYLFSSFRKRKTKALVGLPLFIILIALFFVLARPLMGDMISSAGLSTVDIRPSWGATFSVIKDTLSIGAKNTIIGSGPNTFIYDWLKFKPVEINQTMFWNVRFQNGIGFLPSLIATVGVLGALALLVFLGSLIYYGIKAVSYSDNNITKGLLFGSFLGSIYLWIFNIIYVPGVLVVTLTFLVTGLFLAMLIRSGQMELKEFDFASKAGAGFVASLVIVLLFISSVAGFYFIFQKYVAIYSYIQGIKAINIEGDIDKAQNLFTRAVRIDKQDSYYRSLSDLGLLRLSAILQQDLPQEEARTQFQNILATTIENAQAAVNVNEAEPENWMSLGNIYQNVIPFGIEGSREAALNAYQQATQVSPADPVPFFVSAQVEVQSENNQEARQFLVSALTLKRNYTSALFLLSQITAQEGDLENAIKQTEIARLTSPNDVGILFQLAMLYYQNKDYDNAGGVLEKVVALNPSYSNARYFLGLIYDMANNKEAAIEQFKVIQTLNPDNEEIQKIISNLESGASALSTISPAPENREEPPIEEDNE